YQPAPVQADRLCRTGERSLKLHQLPATMLKLEITEGIVIQNLEDTIAKMRSLKKPGISFAWTISALVIRR
ncbi:hypothetical protein, partial [Pseudomonas viridiflava]|uniref:hypothetical protein n=1 Tax=Pseudomonas viridiflava TaxID=33069 RepID=UPI003BFA79DC